MEEDSEHLSENGRAVSVGAVFGFVWRYWRRRPLAFGLILLGVCVSVALEVLIPTYSAGLVVTVQDYMNGLTAEDVAWHAVWVLLGVFTLRAVLNHLYLRLWVVFAANTMHDLIRDGFSQVQRFSSDWHANNFSGSTVRMVTRGMWAYDTFADTVVVDLGPAFVLLFRFRAGDVPARPFAGCVFRCRCQRIPFDLDNTVFALRRTCKPRVQFG